MCFDTHGKPAVKLFHIRGRQIPWVSQCGPSSDRNNFIFFVTQWTIYLKYLQPNEIILQICHMRQSWLFVKLKLQLIIITMSFWLDCSTNVMSLIAQNNKCWIQFSNLGTTLTELHKSYSWLIHIVTEGHIGIIDSTMIMNINWIQNFCSIL